MKHCIRTAFHTVITVFKRQRLYQHLSCALAFTMALAAVNEVNIAKAANETRSTRSDQTGITLTLYQHNLALVTESRTIRLTSGHNTIMWQDIAPALRPETAWLRLPQHPEELQIRAQHFELRRLTPQSLLESHIGETITIIRTHPATGEEIRETATVLSTEGGAILQYADRIETGVPGRLAFPTIPEHLQIKPALHFTLDNRFNSPAPPAFQLSYLTHGLSWYADYILELDQDDRLANLTGFATLTNQSGIDFHQANTQLIAGDVSQSTPARTPAAKSMHRNAELSSVAAYADIESTPHFEQHRYALPETISLNNDQTRQVSFLSARTITVEKQFVLPGQSHYFSSYYYSPEQKQNIDVYISFQNTDGDLGKPLPRGTIRAYKQDRQGNVHFIGEDSIQHTANQETVRLKLGQVFDISAEKKQTDFKRIPTPDNNIRQFETAHQITLNNAKKELVTVTVREPVPGDWRIISESHPHDKISSQLAEWRIEIPAESQVMLNYRVRTVL